MNPMTKKQRILFDKFRNDIDRIFDDYQLKYESAPVRNGYNRTFGLPIPSKNQILRERDMILKQINADCVLRTGNPVVALPEDEVYESKLTVIAQ